MTSEESTPTDAETPKPEPKTIRRWILAAAILIIAIFVCMSAVWITCPRRATESPKKPADASACLSTEETMAKQPETECVDQLTPTEKYIQTQVEAGQPAKLPPLPADASKVRDEEKNKIRGCFLKKLLIKDQKVTSAGVEIHDAIIVGAIDLRNQEIPHDVAFIHCEFRDWINLKRSHFKKRLSFSESTFFNRFDAESAVIDVDLDFDKCTYKDCLTFLKSVHVGGDFWLGEAKFEGGEADLTNVEVKGDLNADGSEFHQGERTSTEVDPHEPAADFDSMKVSGAATLQDASFYGYAGFGDGRFANLFLDRARFYGNTSFTRTKADGIFLDGANFLAAAPNRQLLTIADMSFQEMTPASWEKLKNFSAATEYQPDFYSNLEALFRRHEYPDEAREVFIAGKQRGREELCYQINQATFFPKVKLTLAWLLNFGLDKSLGYGRHLERALIAGFVILILGWFLAFRKEEWMKTKDPKDKERFAGSYRGFWYSLDLFLPVVDFGDEEIWTPDESRPKSVFYRRIHMILGHILVPLGLAALTFKELVK
jgi:hypothetical protein